MKKLTCLAAFTLMFAGCLQNGFAKRSEMPAEILNGVMDVGTLEACNEQALALAYRQALYDVILRSPYEPKSLIAQLDQKISTITKIRGPNLAKEDCKHEINNAPDNIKRLRDVKI